MTEYGVDISGVIELSGDDDIQEVISLIREVLVKKVGLQWVDIETECLDWLKNKMFEINRKNIINDITSFKTEDSPTSVDGIAIEDLLRGLGFRIYYDPYKCADFIDLKQVLELV